jgi:ABC-type phosphate/phosphonate transport system ATPase subunit
MALNKVTHQVVGSSAQRMISGGQRKRVAIGVELVAKPSLLWLDEPTSGLDASVAYDVVEALKNSSQRGMNILAVMHQPRCSIFNMFDSCLLLSSNGHVVYSGPRAMAMHYMGFIGFYKPAEENTADFLMDVIAGVVPRPGNPDYIPSQLATLWQKCGDIWIEQQLQQQHTPGTCHIQRAHSLYHNLGLDQLPAPTAAAASDVDWPWRPRDLEALLSRFHLLVDNDKGKDNNSMTGFGNADSQGFKASGGVGLSYEGFLSFWDEAGVKDIMGEEQFAEFILGISDDFGMAPGKSITQAEFLEVLKAQLRAAAGVAQPDPFAAAATATDDEDDGDHDEHAHDQQHHQTAAAAAEKPEVAMQVQDSLKSFSPFESYSAIHMVESGDATAAAVAAAAASERSGPVAAAAAGGGDISDQAPKDSCAESCTAIKEYQAAARELAAATKDNSCAAAAVAAAATGPCTAPPEVCEAVKAAAAAVERHGAGTAADFCAAAKAAEAIAAVAGSVCSGRSGLSRSATGDLSTTASYYGSRVCSPGMLTCSAARMQQRMMLRQQSNNSPTPTAATAAGAAAFGSSTLARSNSSLRRQQQHERAMEAVARFKKARKALVKQQSKQQTGLRQLEQVRQMRDCSEKPKTETPAAKDCCSLADARSKCLDVLGDYMLMQHMQQQQREDHMEQQLQEDSGSSSAMGGSIPPVGRTHTFKSLDRVSEVDRSHPESEASASSSKAAAEATAAANAAVAAAAAAAAVKTRRLPSTAQQLRLIIRRSGRKLIACRHALMTDLLLTSVLGLALGVAQGRTQDPGVALLWMLITLLAYGCMMLTRSTLSYGYERHIYLQLENQGGISVTAWVYGHQIFDILGLLIHPALFFAWMYVLTLTPVPWWSYYIVLLVVGWYTSGLGYLVSLLVAPSNVMLSGLAVALLLGGVANGVAPRLWQLENSHPILWLDALSYTRWGLQALYISWLTPSSAEMAPPTAAFLSGLGFCGLQSSLLQAMQSSKSDHDGSSTTAALNLDTAVGRNLWNLTSAERADALASAAADNLHKTAPGSQQSAAAAAALTQLWQYYNDPGLLTQQCSKEAYKAYFVLFGLGFICRILVWIVVKSKAHHKSQE